MNKSQSEGYINPYLGGALLGVVLFLAFYITGNGLGASGAISRFQIAVLKIFSSGTVNSTGYFASHGGGVQCALNHASVLMLIGTFIGGMISGLLNKRFKVEINKGPRITNAVRLISAFIGGMLMGYGARMARGCTSGHGLSGGAVLSVGAFAFMFSIFGAGYAIAWFFRKLWT